MYFTIISIVSCTHDNKLVEAILMTPITRSISSKAIWLSWNFNFGTLDLQSDFVRVEVLRPSQPNGVMSTAVSLPNHMFTGQAQSSKW